MSVRLNWVPQHSIIVVRDKKQIDALEEYKRTGKAFAFTKEEVEEIVAQSPEALRSPTDEAIDTTHAEVMSPGTDTAPVDGKQVAAPKEAKKPAVKDEDL